MFFKKWRFHRGTRKMIKRMAQGKPPKTRLTRHAAKRILKKS